MNKVIAGMLVIGAAFIGFLGLNCGLSTMEEEPNYEPIAVDTSAEEDRLNCTYTISAVYEYQVYSGKGNEKENRYKIVFEDKNLTKIRSQITLNANEEFGSKLLVGQKLTVKEIEENLVY